MMRSLQNPLSSMLKATASGLLSTVISGASLLALSAFAPASAFTLNSCSTTVGQNATYAQTDAVTGNVGCQYLTPASSSNIANQTNVNAAAFFGQSNWVIDSGNSQINPSSIAGSTTKSGTATFDISTDYNAAIIVFKNGSDTNLVAYLLGGLEYGANTISWKTPFLEPPFNFPGNNPRDVSHYSIFFTTTDLSQEYSGSLPGPVPQSVPEPTTILGLAIAGGLGVVMKRKHAKQEQKSVG